MQNIKIYSKMKNKKSSEENLAQINHAKVCTTFFDRGVSFAQNSLRLR